ncbi:MAG: ABC transporter substrate-binding protein [Deltaproteobacteria bacterium]|nr:ABC transporter substrate-binding protein [Deltaproteobacteria bacterium]
MRQQLRLAVVSLILSIFGFVETGETRKVHVAVPDLSMSLIAFIIAKEKHYYRAEGLEVELIKVSAPVANLALIAGNVEFGAAGASAIPSVLRGTPLRFLFHTYFRPLYWLYASPEIRDIKGLKGKRVGVSGIGSGSDTLLREMLQRHGLEGGREVTIMGLGAGTARFVALKAGSVDAVVLSPPGNIMAEEAGFRELVSFVKEDFVELQSAIVVRAGLVQSDPVLVEKFIRATLKGFLYARDNRSGTIPILARIQSMRRDIAEKTYDLSRPAMTPDGSVSEGLQRRALENVLKRLGQKEFPPMEAIFDYSLTRKIRAELEVQGWRPKD